MLIEVRCPIADCERERKVKGFCLRHYEKFARPPRHDQRDRPLEYFRSYRTTTPERLEQCREASRSWKRAHREETRELKQRLSHLRCNTARGNRGPAQLLLLGAEGIS